MATPKKKKENRERSSSKNSYAQQRLITEPDNAEELREKILKKSPAKILFEGLSSKLKIRSKKKVATVKSKERGVSGCLIRPKHGYKKSNTSNKTVGSSNSRQKSVAKLFAREYEAELSRKVKITQHDIRAYTEDSLEEEIPLEQTSNCDATTLEHEVEDSPYLFTDQPKKINIASYMRIKPKKEGKKNLNMFLKSSISGKRQFV